ncbi:MAG: N-acetyl-D-Glu racemase DgcA [Hyphomicrobiales bacterium]
MPMKLNVKHKSWPIAGSFTIARGSKTAAEVVQVTLEHGGAIGHGECVPYPRYNETVGDVIAEFEAARTTIENGISREDVPNLLKYRAGRNALDCALWDLEAKQTGTPVWRLAGLDAPRSLTTAYTLSLETPEKMGGTAEKNGTRPLLKLKLGADDGRDAERLRAVRAHAPDTQLIIDANEGWGPDVLPDLLEVCAEVGVSLVEQPLPASNDSLLADIAHPIPICADESAHDAATLDQVVGKYDAVNIKLDKTGGLTNALVFAKAAEEAGLKLMTGCMLASSLAMAPAMLVGQLCYVVDLDGPLLLAEDYDPPITFEGSIMHPAPAALWG